MGKILRSFAPLALGLVGSLLGPASFARYGFAIGSLIGGILFGEKPPRYASNVGDLKVAGAGYGSPIKRIYGTMRTAGDVIDCRYTNNGTVAAPIKKKKDTDGSGKSKTSSTKLLETIAIAWGHGELDLVVLWFEDSNGSRVVFNANAAAGKQGYTLTPLHDANGQLVAQVCDELRHYRGTFTQPPDSVLAGFHPGGVPRYGGISYTVLVDFRLKNGQGTFSALVRSPLTNKCEIISHRLGEGDFPASRLDLDTNSGALAGNISTHVSGGGCAVTGIEGPSELVDRLCTISVCDLAPVDGLLVDRPRANPVYHLILESELGATMLDDITGKLTDAPDLIKIEQRNKRDNPTNLTLSFQDINLNYNDNAVTARRYGCDYENSQEISLPIASTQPEMQVLADLLLDELWAAQSTGEVSLLPGRVNCGPGDVLIIPYQDEYLFLRIAEQNLGPDGAIVCKGPLYDSGVYGQYRDIGSVISAPPTVAVMDAPTGLLMNVPATSDDLAQSPYVMGAACVSRNSYWEGASFVPEVPGTLPATAITDQATMGKLTTAYSFERIDCVRFDYDTVLRLELDFGSVASSDEEGVKDLKANALAVQTPTGILLLQFVTATPVSDGVWDISGLLPGRSGTEYANSVPVNSPVVVLTDENGDDVLGPVWIPYPSRLIDSNAEFRLQAGDNLGLDSGVQSVTLEGETVRAPSPVRVSLERTASSLTVSWNGRTRLDAGASWAITNATYPDDYLVELTNGTHTITKTVRSSTDAVFSSTELSVFGGIPTEISGSVAQLCPAGLGHPLEWENL